MSTADVEDLDRYERIAEELRAKDVSCRADDSVAFCTITFVIATGSSSERAKERAIRLGAKRLIVVPALEAARDGLVILRRN